MQAAVITKDSALFKIIMKGLREYRWNGTIMSTFGTDKDLIGELKVTHKRG